MLSALGESFNLQLVVQRLRDTAQVHRRLKLLHGRQLNISHLTVLGPDPIHNQAEFLLLQTEYDLQAAHSGHHTRKEQ